MTTVTFPNSALNLRLIIFQLAVLLIAPVWVLKLAHYFSFPMSLLFDSRSLVPETQGQALQAFGEVNLIDTLGNIVLFGGFFLQHILMARLSFKIHCQKLWPQFPTYERLIYNITSSLLLILVLEYQQPQNLILFTLPLWTCLPLNLLGLFFLLDSNLQMQGSLLLPYKFSQLFSSRQVSIPPTDYTQVQSSGITVKGSYSMIRHPMQSGCILLLTFGNGTFTLEKVVILSFFFAFIFVGVIMEERRLLKKYRQYENYMNEVKCRFVPYVF